MDPISALLGCDNFVNVFFKLVGGDFGEFFKFCLVVGIFSIFFVVCFINIM